MIQVVVAVVSGVVSGGLFAVVCLCVWGRIERGQADRKGEQAPPAPAVLGVDTATPPRGVLMTGPEPCDWVIVPRCQVKVVSWLEARGYRVKEWPKSWRCGICGK
jgi:hypothetical protein